MPPPPVCSMASARRDRLVGVLRDGVPGLSEAVALASELCVMGHGRVQIRPASRRLLDRRWR